MKIAFFDSHNYDRDAFLEANQKYGFDIHFVSARLNLQTVELAKGFKVLCSFVSDRLDAKTLAALKALGVELIALRSAGYNHVDVQCARSLNLSVVRVPEYSPHAVAEHAVAMLLALNRKIHRAYARVREMNFSLDGLVGFDLYGKTVGVIGTGKIGAVFAEIMMGFGCRIFAFDLQPDEDLQKKGVKFVSWDVICRDSDILSLHIPLVPETRHILDANAFTALKPGAIVINTGRGGLIDTKAMVKALKSRKLGGAALDVYEEEEGIFFEDKSETGIDDDQLARLLTFPNVLVTSHQGFLTHEALKNIAETTLSSVAEHFAGKPLTHKI